MAEETENTATPATDEAPPATNGKSKPERKPREEGPPIEELFDLTKPIPKVSPWTDFAGCPVPLFGAFTISRVPHLTHNFRCCL